jgi:hypothetical protein
MLAAIRDAPIAHQGNDLPAKKYPSDPPDPFLYDTHNPNPNISNA